MEPARLFCPLSMGFPRQEYWSGFPIPSPEGLPDPGIEPGYPAFQADSLPTEPPGGPILTPGVVCVCVSSSVMFDSVQPQGL